MLGKEFYDLICQGCVIERSLWRVDFSMRLASWAALMSHDIRSLTY